MSVKCYTTSCLVWCLAIGHSVGVPHFTNIEAHTKYVLERCLVVHVAQVALAFHRTVSKCCGREIPSAGFRGLFLPSIIRPEKNSSTLRIVSSTFIILAQGFPLRGRAGLELYPVIK